MTAAWTYIEHDKLAGLVQCELMGRIVIPDRKYSRQSMSPLFYSAYMGSVKCFKYLLSLEDEYSKFDYCGYLSLTTVAAEGGSIEIMKYLRQNGFSQETDPGTIFGHTYYEAGRHGLELLSVVEDMGFYPYNLDNVWSCRYEDCCRCKMYKSKYCNLHEENAEELIAEIRKEIINRI